MEVRLDVVPLLGDVMLANVSVGVANLGLVEAGLGFQRRRGRIQPEQTGGHALRGCRSNLGGGNGDQGGRGEKNAGHGASLSVDASPAGVSIIIPQFRIEGDWSD